MQLYFKKYGEGNPIVLLHGLFGNSDNWVTFARQLSENIPVSVYTIDMRNHGRSPHHPSFSMEALVDDLNDFLVQNDIESPILIGHSLGGKVILNYLKEPFSNDVKAIVIADMGLRKYELKYSHVELLSLMKNAPIELFSSRNEAEDFFRDAIPSQKLQQFVLKNLKRNSDHKFEWKLNLEAIDSYIDGLIGEVNFTKKNTVPALFLKGELSDYINPEDEILISKAFENSRIVTIPNAGHWIHVDNHEKMLAEVLWFLNGFDYSK